MANRIEYVKKRDGRIVPFDKKKIADAIFKAAQSVGGQDRYLAEDLAEVVKIYLEKEYKGDTPSVEEIQDIVERVLIKTGHAKTAKAYILYRQRRARARQIREGRRPEDLSERETLKDIKRDISISVRRSDDKKVVWDKTAIIEALIRETSISRNIAEIIVAEVEEDVVASKVKNITSSMIREMVNVKLLLYGFEKERLKHSRIGIPFYDISSIFENFNGPPDILSTYLGRRIKREFAINTIIPQAIVERHIKGEISIESIEGIDKILTAYIPVNTLDEIPHLYKNVAPIVEGDIVFSLPEDISSIDKIFFNENPFVLEVPYRLIKDKMIERPKTYVVKVDSKDDFERVMNTGEKTHYFFSLHRKAKEPLLVLNRIALNIPVINAYAEQDNLSLRIRLSEILKALYDMVVSQEGLIKKVPYTRDGLSVFAGYSPTVEIECEEKGEDERMPDEEFFSEILSYSFSVFVKDPSDRLIEVSGRCFENQDVIARIYNG